MEVPHPQYGFINMYTHDTLRLMTGMAASCGTATALETREGSLQSCIVYGLSFIFC